MATVAVTITVGGCSSPRAPLVEGPPIVEIRMTDNRFQYPQPVPAGRVVFVVRNAGRVDHRLAMVPLPDDFPPIDEQVRGSVRRTMAPYAGVSTRAPGTRGTFAVDLVPGQRYAMVCFVRDEDGRTHAQKGMTAEFHPPGASPSTEAPPSSPPSSTEPADPTAQS